MKKTTLGLLPLVLWTACSKNKPDATAPEAPSAARTEMPEVDPPPSSDALPPEPETEPEPEPMDAMDTAANAGSYATFISAVETAEVADSFRAEGPITVFIPTDEAFSAMGHDFEHLLEPSHREDLQHVLHLHIVSGVHMAADLEQMHEAESINQHHLHIEASADGITIDGAKVLEADIVTSNGVIHVIDTVLTEKKKRRK